MAKSPVPPEHDVALVTPPTGQITTVWWEWLQRYIQWDEACCAGGDGGGGETGPEGPPGPAGPAGPTGPTGATGAAGVGVPVGGTTGQVLAKIDATNYNTQWVTPSGGGGSYLPLAGGTLTGNLTIAAPNIATLTLDDQGALSDGNAGIFNWKRLATNRWAMFLDAPESSGNAGSNWAVARYSDVGSFIDLPLKITRSSGNVTLAQSLSVGGNLSVALASEFLAYVKVPLAAPTDPQHAANKAYVDSLGSSGITDAPSDGAEYVRVSGAWRKRSQSFDLNGLTTLDIDVPSTARAMKLDVTAWQSTATVVALGWRGSLDGTTFLSAAADYYYVGQSHFSGSSAFAGLAGTSSAYGVLTLAADTPVVPHNARLFLSVSRPSTSTNLWGMANSQNYHSSASAVYGDFQVRTLMNSTNMGSSLRLQKLRLLWSATNTFASGSFADVEWIY